MVSVDPETEGQNLKHELVDPGIEIQEEQCVVRSRNRQSLNIKDATPTGMSVDPATEFNMQCVVGSSNRNKRERKQHVVGSRNRNRRERPWIQQQKY